MLKIAASATAGLLVLVAMFAAATAAVFSAPFGGSAAPSRAALTDIPADYLALYQEAAATCPGLDWAVLAAIGKIETDHGRSPLPGVHSGRNDAGAGGPMQFLQATFDAVTARHRIPPGGASPPSRYHPHDAIHAAAFYLCASGARHGRDLRGAIFTYNRATWYVDRVLTQATRYTHTPPTSAACPPAQAAPLHPANHSQAGHSPALAAVAFACAQLGKPYVWGGNGDPGFDCSGLTHAAYAAAGIGLPRTAHTQYLAGPLLPPDAPLQPGDLIFFGTPHRVHHVGLSLGGTTMIHAPTFGEPVQTGDYRTHPDFLAATRPMHQD